MYIVISIPRTRNERQKVWNVEWRTAGSNCVPHMRRLVKSDTWRWRDLYSDTNRLEFGGETRNRERMISEKTKKRRGPVLAFGFWDFLFFIRSRSRASNATDWWKLTGGFCLMAGSNGYVIFMVPRFCLVKNTQSGANDFRKKRSENGSSRFFSFLFIFICIRSRSRASPGPDQQALGVFLHSIGGERDLSELPETRNRERMNPEFLLPKKRRCTPRW